MHTQNAYITDTLYLTICVTAFWFANRTNYLLSMRTDISKIQQSTRSRTPYLPLSLTLTTEHLNGKVSFCPCPTSWSEPMIIRRHSRHFDVVIISWHFSVMLVAVIVLSLCIQSGQRIALTFAKIHPNIINIWYDQLAIITNWCLLYVKLAILPSDVHDACLYRLLLDLIYSFIPIPIYFSRCIIGFV